MDAKYKSAYFKINKYKPLNNVLQLIMIQTWLPQLPNTGVRMAHMLTNNIDQPINPRLSDVEIFVCE